GAGGLEALPGSHGTLEADVEGQTFDFHTTGGNRYHFVPDQAHRWLLDRVVDPDGNVTTLTYSQSGAERLLRRVTDASGRSLDFFYQERELALWQGSVLVRVTGPEGLELAFDYDGYGNLVSAERDGGAQLESYSYERVAGWAFEVRSALTEALDEVRGASRRYSYQVAEIPVQPGEAVSSLLASTLTTPEEGTTGFIWDTAALGARSETLHRVVDGRGFESEYRFSNYGSPLEVVDGEDNVTRMEWDPENLVMTRHTDGRDTVTDREHDEHGNLLRETVTVTDYDGTEQVYTSTATYLPSDQPPYIRNLPASRTDRNGATVSFTYDAQGNLVTESRVVTDADGTAVTLVTSHTYDALGQRQTTTDPRGGVTTFHYDEHGNVARVIDPLGRETTTTWDAQGQPVSIRDALGRVTQLSYDTLGRLTARRHPDEGVETIDYFDGLRLRVETDALGRVTRTTSDREGRVVLIENPAGGQKVFEYDAEGNKTLESRWFDADTPRDDILLEYDAAGRLVARREAGRVTRFAYDAAGNVVSERLESAVEGAGFAPRVTDRSYDELGRPIEVRRLLGEAEWVVTHVQYDGEGNTVLEEDALGRQTLHVHDELGRRISTVEPGLLESRRFYDGNGNVVRSELHDLADPEAAVRVRQSVYDATDRLVSEVDAEGHARSFEYDAAGNLVRETDRRGDLTSYAYDARNRRTRTTVHL
ncbi:MAG: RHS repeat protein, partial [Planctomycetes bacterium]|nr:RHS repeat protein [Planctomycetota bacterium]